MKSFAGKKVLFVCPIFFGYEREIELELINLGVEVDYFNERPFTSSVAKILNRLNFKFFIKENIKKYYNTILDRVVSVQYDVLLVVNPETMTPDFIRQVKKYNPSIRTILYFWDSIKNKRNSFDLVDEFDKVVTFDKNDAQINSRINFLPLFYTNTYDVNAVDKKDCYDTVYKAAFIGTAHSDRYKLVNNILAQIQTVKLSNFIFFYCPSKLLYILKKMLTRELEGISLRNVSFKSMSAKSIVEVLHDSQLIIDIEHPNQNGLTMRTIEMLGLQKKLITTNKNIIDYDFYNSNNIFIVDRANPQIDVLFLQTEYQPIDSSIREQYSLNSWLKKLLE